MGPGPFEISLGNGPGYEVGFWAEDGGFWLTEVLFDKNGQNM